MLSIVLLFFHLQELNPRKSFCENMFTNASHPNALIICTKKLLETVKVKYNSCCLLFQMHNKLRARAEMEFSIKAAFSVNLRHGKHWITSRLCEQSARFTLKLAEQ